MYKKSGIRSIAHLVGCVCGNANAVAVASMMAVYTGHGRDEQDDPNEEEGQGPADGSAAYLPKD